MKNFISIYVCCFVGMFVASCSSGESKAKQVVLDFCEAYQSQQSDNINALYPDFTAGDVQIGQIDMENLTVSEGDNIWNVEDGAGHVFYVGEIDGKLVIQDSKNVIAWESVIGGDVKAAKLLGMVDDDSSDIQRIKAYTQLQDNSELVEFLKGKHPEAFVYGITVDNVTKRKEGGMGIYWWEVKATLKSGAIEPLGFITVKFIVKDKDGNILNIDDSPAKLSENDVKVIDGMVDLSDYPNASDVEVKLAPFGNKKSGVSDIDLLCAYSYLTNSDYQEYLDSKK